MKFDIWDTIKEDGALGEKFAKLHVEQTVPAKTVLLEAGQIAQKLYIIKKGCVRLWFNKDGKDITLQLFFEGDGVASIESFMQGVPSLFSLETIEPTALWVYDKANLFEIIDHSPILKAELHRMVVGRLINYTHLFLSRIKDTPQERYENLVAEHPFIIQRVPLHYIASYLGITAVSLSRIRSRH